MAVLVLLLAAVVALLGVLVAGLLRSHAEILRALHELGVGLDPDEEPSGRSAEPTRLADSGRTATDVAGLTPHGDAISVSVVDAEHATLLAFLTSGCTTCAGFWSAFADPRLEVPGDARLVVVTKGADGDSPARLTKFAPPDVPVVMSSEAWDAYEVPVAPYFVYVDGPSGTVVGEGASATWEHLGDMLEQALADAGIATGRRRRGRRRQADRTARIDDTLLGAGIEPGDPSLYPAGEPDLEARSGVPRPDGR